jgi:t-SNARE complex subunit (syntaxin)
MESAAMAELKIMTDDIRNAVLRKESEVNEQRRNIETLQGSRKQNSRMLRKTIKSFDTKRVALEKKRKTDVESIKTELKHLRELCGEVDAELELDRLKKEAFMGVFSGLDISY